METGGLGVMTMNRYCSECLTRTNQHCDGRDATTNDTTNNMTGDTTKNCVNGVQVVFTDGSYEVRPDYMQAGAGGSGNRLHGLDFCSKYVLDPKMLPKMKSAQEVRDEFNAQRAAIKAATKAKKDAAKAEKTKQKATERKLKAKQKITERKAKALKQKIASGQRAAEQATKAVMMPETASQAVNSAMEIDDFSDLII